MVFSLDWHARFSGVGWGWVCLGASRINLLSGSTRTWNSHLSELQGGPLVLRLMDQIKQHPGLHYFSPDSKLVSVRHCLVLRHHAPCLCMKFHACSTYTTLKLGGGVQAASLSGQTSNVHQGPTRLDKKSPHTHVYACTCAHP